MMSAAIFEAVSSRRFAVEQYSNSGGFVTSFSFNYTKSFSRFSVTRLLSINSNGSGSNRPSRTRSNSTGARTRLYSSRSKRA